MAGKSSFQIDNKRRFIMGSADNIIEEYLFNIPILIS